jgi:hypothetical protein
MFSRPGLLSEGPGKGGAVNEQLDWNTPNAGEEPSGWRESSYDDTSWEYADLVEAPTMFSAAFLRPVNISRSKPL